MISLEHLFDPIYCLICALVHFFSFTLEKDPQTGEVLVYFNVMQGTGVRFEEIFEEHSFPQQSELLRLFQK